LVRAIVVAAGQSKRMGEDTDKQLLTLSGRPVLAHSLAILDQAEDIKEYVLVVNIRHLQKFSQLARGEWGCRKLAGIVPGGIRRQDSVWEGLQALPRDTGIVLVHDGARPFVSSELISKVIEQARKWGAATLAVPINDTVKKVDSQGLVLNTIPRESLWLTQTPQAFICSLLLEAHRWARAAQMSATDDASLVEATGHCVRVVEGSSLNIKITTPDDLAMALAIAQVAWEDGR